MVGSGMAAEALRILTGGAGKPVLHILHMGGSPMVRTVGMRGPSPKCVACGPEAREELGDDYDALCAAPELPKEAADRLSVKVSTPAVLS